MKENIRPSEDSVQLTKTIMDVGTPLVDYVAIIVGDVMKTNYAGVTEILGELRDEFDTHGASELFAKVQAQVDELFVGFFNEGEDAGELEKPEKK